jgi:adenylate cyclase
MLTPAPLRRLLVRRLVWIVASGSLTGQVYANVEYGAPVVGAVAGGAMGAALFSLERFVLRRNSGAFFLRLPFLPYLGLRSILYAAVIILVFAGVNWLLSPDSRFVVPTRVDFLVSLAMVVGVNLLFGVNDLLGPSVLFRFVAGRYYQQRVEERVLLFIDMRSSTAIAERLGELRFLDFLNRFITDVSLAIVEAGGEIHKYVGDEIIATWNLAPGPNQAGAVHACFAALDRLSGSGPAYEREFGLRADFRASLHCGPVVVGELGFLKKEIALIGDTMNTAARIQQACRDTGCRVLASAVLLDRVTALPAGVKRRSLGPLPMRGKERTLALYALEVESDIVAGVP